MSQDMKAIKVVVGDWPSCRDDAMAIRHEVFVEEQHVPPEFEMDAEDEQCVHAVAYDAQGKAMGTGRLLDSARIGRMAVRQAYRSCGVGSSILAELMNEARRRHYMEVALAAQLDAQAFYAKHGFVAEGGVYMDAGIQHVTMRRALTT